MIKANRKFAYRTVSQSIVGYEEGQPSKKPYFGVCVKAALILALIITGICPNDNSRNVAMTSLLGVDIHAM